MDVWMDGGGPPTDTSLSLSLSLQSETIALLCGNPRRRAAEYVTGIREFGSLFKVASWKGFVVINLIMTLTEPIQKGYLNTKVATCSFSMTLSASGPPNITKAWDFTSSPLQSRRERRTRRHIPPFPEDNLSQRASLSLSLSWNESQWIISLLFANVGGETLSRGPWALRSLPLRPHDNRSCEWSVELVNQFSYFSLISEIWHTNEKFQHKDLNFVKRKDTTYHVYTPLELEIPYGPHTKCEGILHLVRGT